MRKLWVAVAAAIIGVVTPAAVEVVKVEAAGTCYGHRGDYYGYTYCPPGVGFQHRVVVVCNGGKSYYGPWKNGGSASYAYCTVAGVGLVFMQTR
jgi:hypothetical protein